MGSLSVYMFPGAVVEQALACYFAMESNLRDRLKAERRTKPLVLPPLGGPMGVRLSKLPNR